MCWSEGVSVAMVGLGTAATLVSARRGLPRAIPATLAFFTLMEALQVGGYWVIDQCGTAENRIVTLLSYVHIAVQPIFINAFAMAIAPRPVSAGMRRVVYALAALATAMLLFRLAPVSWAGQCQPGDVLCGPFLCTRSGTWHLAWEVPLNDLWGGVSGLFGDAIQFPSYMIAVFVLPLAYGAWRFALFHLTFGPVLASLLTTDPNEMPAIWCLTSIALVLVALCPPIRTRVLAAPA
ncbi:DUF5765 domain-containing protein [Thetidibacter halocola]|uniref:Uncharacterized protein n=1 Tax=Thetidibacter halocola TaxID=2827239 RepID=A0A8J7WF93_9RHOB|nr:DUF5765 domain-containing protein [Thetidibacter halocola]MBS0126592.1 hypothetical protein [Thetidibacter halocola]